MHPMDIDSWLRELGLERYVAAFRDNDIDADTLVLLSETDLEELGVISSAHRGTLLAAIGALKAEDAVPVPIGSGESSGAVVRGERRTVTVLFCNIIDFSALSGELGDEGVHQLLDRFYVTVDSMVKRYGGYVDKHIGDTVMAVFGAPVAHTNDPERAVRAAFAIRQAVRYLRPPVRVHTGIASGSVVASSTGSHTHVEYTVTGPAVNLASRLHELAGPQEIMVSESVRQAVEPWVESTGLDGVAIKGVSPSARVWRLDALRPEASQGARTAFVGRAMELHTFAALLDRCRRGHGQVLHVRGEAGIGKTRLVEELRAMADEQGFSCHTGHVLDFGDAQGAVAELLCSLLSVSNRSTPAERKNAARTAQYLGMMAEDAEVYLNDLLDLPQPGPQRLRYDAMSPEGRNQGKRQTLTDFILRRAAKRPQLIVIEDLHWSDGEIVGHVEHLARNIASAAVLLVVTSRLHGDPMTALARDRAVPLTAVELSPLGVEEALALATSVIDADRAQVMRCIERAEGNPLFLEQLLRTAEETSAEVLPDTIQSNVQARIDNLLPADKLALQTASVLGQRFTLPELRFLLDDQDYGCERLIEHHLLRHEGDDYVFAHELILEGVYSSLLKTRQRVLHQRAAEWFAGRNPTLRAEHLERASDRGAAAAYLEAARAQAAGYRFERALQLCDRGLALCRRRAADRHEKRPAMYELTSFRAEVLRMLGRIPACIAEHERAQDLAGNDVERCRTWVGMAHAMRIIDLDTEALALLDRAQIIGTTHQLIDELASIHYLRGNLRFLRGDIDGCLEQHTRALSHAREVASPEREAQALSGLGDAYYMRGRMVSAHAHFDRCIELCREHALGGIEVANLAMRGITRYYQNDVVGGLKDAVDGARGASRVGHKRAEIIARSSCTGWILLEMGQLDEAREEVQMALELVRSVGTRRFEANPRIILSKILALQGRQGEARAMAEKGVACCRKTDMVFIGPMALAALALVTDDEDQRRRALAEGEAIVMSGAISHNYLYFYRDGMEVALRAGQPELVERYAAALEEYTRLEPLPWSQFFIERGRVLAEYLRGTRTDMLLADLRRLHDHARSVGLYLAARFLAHAIA
jgi:class 3 adenylate cyclase/tetratricopeptide (TPR) repeat protein